MRQTFFFKCPTLNISKINSFLDLKQNQKNYQAKAEKLLIP